MIELEVETEMSPEGIELFDELRDRIEAEVYGPLLEETIEYGPETA